MGPWGRVGHPVDVLPCAHALQAYGKPMCLVDYTHGCMPGHPRGTHMAWRMQPALQFARMHGCQCLGGPPHELDVPQSDLGRGGSGDALAGSVATAATAVEDRHPRHAASGSRLAQRGRLLASAARRAATAVAGAAAEPGRAQPQASPRPLRTGAAARPQPVQGNKACTRPGRRQHGRPATSSVTCLPVLLDLGLHGNRSECRRGAPVQAPRPPHDASTAPAPARGALAYIARPWRSRYGVHCVPSSCGLHREGCFPWPCTAGPAPAASKLGLGPAWQGTLDVAILAWSRWG